MVRAAPSVPQPLGEAPRGGNRTGGSSDPPAVALSRWRSERDRPALAGRGPPEGSILKGLEDDETVGRQTGHGKNGFPVAILEVSREGSAEARALPGGHPSAQVWSRRTSFLCYPGSGGHGVRDTLESRLQCHGN